MHVIATANQKGGTAKTTTAAAFGVLLARSGIRTHLVDMDPQASLTISFGQFDPKGTLYEALHRRCQLPVLRISKNLSLTPSSIDLSQGETQFMAETGREHILQTCLLRTDLPKDSVVILDCPPSLGVLSINCLAAANSVCVVVQPGGFELRTLVHLNETVAVLKQRINPGLTIAGAVITNCHPRRAITDQVATEVAEHYPVLGRVRADARLLYATTAGKIYYLTRSKALEDYQLAVDRLRQVLSWPRNTSAA
jgi:chromosome partitioning protein